MEHSKGIHFVTNTKLDDPDLYAIITVLPKYTMYLTFFIIKVFLVQKIKAKNDLMCVHKNFRGSLFKQQLDEQSEVSVVGQAFGISYNMSVSFTITVEPIMTNCHDFYMNVPYSFAEQCIWFFPFLIS